MSPRLRLAPLAALIALTATATVAQAAPTTVKVMTRNLYLGADLGPGLKAANLQELVNGAGVIFNEVDANNFKVRAKGLAREILDTKPDLVGLQEAALWRTQPCSNSPLPPSATTVRYDYVALLLAQLNRGARRYRAVVTKPEFDFEVWANTDANQATAAPGCPMGSEINGRLTMRDVILARTGVRTSKPRSGTFQTLLQVAPAGVKVDVTRGWTSIEARKGGKRFRFVNAHLEAFDNQPANHTNQNTDVGNGRIREAQARELTKLQSAYNLSPLTQIFLGDFNSDVKTEVKPGDSLAYRALRAAGLVERGATRPLSCCIESSTLKTSAGGKLSDFDHQVDHVMTDSPRKVRLVSTSVTGRRPATGYWNSDHAGIFSRLSVR